MNERAEIELLVTQLEEGAAKLKSGRLSLAESTALVSECADLAGRLTAAFERLANHQPEPPAGQERLVGSTQERLL